jgi:uncharacterized membrane protein YhfC
MKNVRLKEWQRTIILLVLLAIAIGFILWSRNQYASNFTESF